MNWLTASERDKVRAEGRLRQIHLRLLRIGDKPKHLNEQIALRAERAEIVFGDKPFPRSRRRKVRRRR